MAAWLWVLWTERLSSGQKAFLKFGMPMVLLVVIGSFGLSEFTEIKMKKRDEKVRKFCKIFLRLDLPTKIGPQYSKNMRQMQFQLNYEETQKLHVKKKEKPLTLEEAYKEVQSIDIEKWDNKRVPRPWSEDIK